MVGPDSTTYNVSGDCGSSHNPEMICTGAPASPHVVPPPDERRIASSYESPPRGALAVTTMYTVEGGPASTATASGHG